MSSGPAAPWRCRLCRRCVEKVADILERIDVLDEAIAAAENCFFERLRGAHMPRPRCCGEQQTRGFVFIDDDFPGTRCVSRSLALSGGEFFQDASRDFL